MEGLCINCGRYREMIQVWRSGGKGKQVQTHICKDREKCRNCED